MAKKGMKRPERTHVKPKNEQPPVPMEEHSKPDRGESIPPKGPVQL